MKVCLDIQPAVAQSAGIGRYTRLLMQHLPRCAGAGDELSFFCFDFRRRARLACEKCVCRAVRWMPGMLAQQAWKRLHWPPFNWLSGKADVYHFPNFIIPPLTRGRAVVTVHDLSFLHFPHFAEKRNLVYLNAELVRTVARADAVITDSAFCAAEIAAAFPSAAGKVRAVPLGVDTDLAPAPAEELQTWRRSRGLTRPYILSVGTLEPRKNFEFLIGVFEQLDGFDGELVIAGKCGWKYAPILERMQTSPAAARIHWLEDIGDRELPYLYSGAEVLVFTSFYEGFGFPPLEAMACGTPVVSSRGGALAETVGDGGWLVPDFDAEAWRVALQTILFNRTRRADWINRGRAWVKQFDWQLTAQKTWQIYREVFR